LPVELRVAGDRRKRLREAKQALDAEREADAAPVPRDRGQRLRDAAAGSSKITNSSGGWSPNTTRGLRPGSPAAGRAE